MKKRDIDWPWVIMITTILAIIIVICGACAFSISQSGESAIVSYNVSKEANNFNVQRRLTVINARTDTILLQFEGTFSISNNSTNELEIICKVDEDKYQKHYVYLNEYTIYVVEDISGTSVDKYHYEINFLPEYGITVTTED